MRQPAAGERHRPALSLAARGRQLIIRLSRLGIPEDMPPEDAKHVQLINQIALVAMSVLLIFAPLEFALDHPASRLWACVELVTAALLIIPMALNSMGRHWLATTVACLIGVAATSVGTVIVGAALGVKYYLMFFALVPFVAYPRRHLASAVCISALALGSLLGLFWLTDGAPWVGPPWTPDKSKLSILGSLLGVFCLVATLGYYTRGTTHRAEDAAAREREASEELLLNILPGPIAARLKRERQVIADRHEEVTVLFADIVGFTPMSKALGPDEVVMFLNVVFSELDKLADKHGLEKIKTIGDAYMVAGGLPTPKPDNAEAVAAFALDTLQAVAGLQTPGGFRLGVRMGMNTGPAVAGVIGQRKFSYDLWGDTVNTASRMESHGNGGEIQVTRACFEKLHHKFHLVPRGLIDIKGKGAMETWWLKGRKGEAVME